MWVGLSKAYNIGAVRQEETENMSDVPLLPLWVTVFLTIWAAIGPLLGIVIGHYLTRSWQRSQWIADNQKEEYQKVVAGLNRLNMILVDQHSDGHFDIATIKPAMEEITVALNTSLFIIDFLVESKVADAVLDAVTRLMKGGSFDDYHEKYWKAVNLIIASAKKEAL